MTGSNSAGPIRSVCQCRLVVEALAARRRSESGRLARRLEMPKTSTHRSLETLAHAGWVTSTGEDQVRWSLTNRALIVGLSTASAGNLADWPCGR